eukprot:TRINITY_DN26729_c0_g1_i1.p1 TRINITY_DN26729_c0_g1~~TRINITY_DN26729_c0_g1_i1.p1  ORF type:complete len:364 (-),score=15.21 TRINITY_DN26729_c0_g1_i1:325-1416(-)
MKTFNGIILLSKITGILASPLVPVAVLKEEDPIKPHNEVSVSVTRDVPESHDHDSALRALISSTLQSYPDTDTALVQLNEILPDVKEALQATTFSAWEGIEFDGTKDLKSLSEALATFLDLHRKVSSFVVENIDPEAYAYVMSNLWRREESEIKDTDDPALVELAEPLLAVIESEEGGGRWSDQGYMFRLLLPPPTFPGVPGIPEASEQSVTVVRVRNVNNLITIDENYTEIENQVGKHAVVGILAHELGHGESNHTFEYTVGEVMMETLVDMDTIHDGLGDVRRLFIDALSRQIEEEADRYAVKLLCTAPSIQSVTGRVVYLDLEDDEVDERDTILKWRHPASSTRIDITIDEAGKYTGCKV